YHHGLRDLFDLHRLLTHFGADPAFWPALAKRAEELGLLRPLYYALRYAGILLGTGVPQPVRQAVNAGAPGKALLALMDFLFLRALLPAHPSCDGAATPMARQLLYLRGNWLRMPPLLLTRHLFHKAFLSGRTA
ncbi:MAG TPA: nucleotidyltransferase family protein, partial [Burkholderiaceae bacterium]